jgi:hypothetical protein
MDPPSFASANFLMAGRIRLHAYIRPRQWRTLRSPGHDGICALPPQQLLDLCRHGLRDTQGLEELVGPVSPSVHHNPRNRHRGGSLSTVCGYQRAVAYALVVRQQAAIVVPAADTQVARRYGSPLASNTQAIRAVLFAWATHARFVPRRALTSCSQRLRASVLRSTVRMTARAPWMRSFLK